MIWNIILGLSLMASQTGDLNHSETKGRAPVQLSYQQAQTLPAPSTQAQAGPLIIIGGGKIPASIHQKIIALAGGTKARILIVPLASTIPLEVGESAQKQFQALGVPQVEVFGCQAGKMDTEICLQQIRSATGIFFTGGDQNKLAAAFGQTQAFQALVKQHQSGKVLAGTSAGAAIMSKVMLTGDQNNPPQRDPAEPTPEDRPFDAIQKQRVQTTHGFGFVNKYIIDQHFIKRQRQNRLISVVLDQPDLIGIGIDESTGILVSADQSFEVLGDATVMVFDARQAAGIAIDSQQNYAVRNLKVHLLKAGQRYDWR